jgi:hypothetical protein
MPRRNPEDIDLGAIKTDLEFLIERVTRFRKEQALKPLYTMIGSAAIVIAWIELFWRHCLWAKPRNQQLGFWQAAACVLVTAATATAPPITANASATARTSFFIAGPRSAVWTAAWAGSNVRAGDGGDGDCAAEHA